VISFLTLIPPTLLLCHCYHAEKEGDRPTKINEPTIIEIPPTLLLCHCYHAEKEGDRPTKINEPTIIEETTMA